MHTSASSQTCELYCRLICSVARLEILSHDYIIEKCVCVCVCNGHWDSVCSVVALIVLLVQDLFRKVSGGKKGI
jgi:hypothetical protein